MTDHLNIDEIKEKIAKFTTDREWNRFHHPKNLAMALSVEASELVEIFQWMKEEESLSAKHDALVKEKTSHELADILIYLIRIADLMQINLSEAIVNKMALNAQKYPVELVKGQSKKYTEY